MRIEQLQSQLAEVTEERDGYRFHADHCTLIDERNLLEGRVIERQELYREVARKNQDLQRRISLAVKALLAATSPVVRGGQKRK